MGAKRPVRRSDCPTAYALDTFGDRWTLLIVRDLMLQGPLRYSDLLAGGENIATNILADRLSRLEGSGIIESSPDPENKRAKHYRLSDKGIDLAPLMLELILWSAKYDPETPVTKGFVRRARQDREAALKGLMANARGAPER